MALLALLVPPLAAVFMLVLERLERELGPRRVPQPPPAQARPAAVGPSLAALR